MQRRNEALEKSLSKSQKEKIQADMLSVKYELESDRGQELALLLRKIRVLVNLETNRPTKHCYGTRSKTKDMDQRMERLEQSQKEMQEQLQKQMNEQQKMIDKMMESQGSMMAQLTKWFNKGTDKGKGSMLNIEEGDNEGPVYPPDFTPQQVEIYPRRSSVTINPPGDAATL
ncbi:hypothetical protein Gotur_024747 [Gossypium turneri]